MRTSSPGFNIVMNDVATACLPPFVTSTWLAPITSPVSRLDFATMASRRSARPAVVVRRVKASLRRGLNYVLGGREVRLAGTVADNGLSSGL